MFLTLPKGQTLRAVAERLGVAVEELQRHTAVKDVDAPAVIDQRLEVPDGFLRSKRGKQELTDAMSSPSGKRGGMNMWLALDIEQKRTRAAGGMKNKMRDSDSEALAEAMESYLRFEAKSNDLAADLFDDITLTISTETRAHAFAGLGCCQAQRHLIFGQPANPCRVAALSSAKAAQLADPKLATGHMAMALALQIAATPADFQEARDELARACELDPESAICRAELARLEIRAGDLAAARQAADQALAISPTFILALDADAQLLIAAGERSSAIDILRGATAATPTFADSWARLASLVKANKQDYENALENARTNAVSAEHQQRIRAEILAEV